MAGSIHQHKFMQQKGERSFRQGSSPGRLNKIKPKNPNMKTKQYLQDIAQWQWDLSGYQKAAFLIEERLDAIHKNIPSQNPKSIRINRLLEQIVDQERELNDMEKNILMEKEAIRKYKENSYSPSELDHDHQVNLRKFGNEEVLFTSIKKDYYELLEDLLLR